MLTVSAMIHVLTTISSTSGNRESLLTELKRLVPAVCAEDGCIAFSPAVDAPSKVANQQSPRSDTVVVVEQWRDLAALQAHLKTPHLVAHRERVKSLVQALQLQVLQPI